jgi:hypothetical protein
MVFIQSTTSKLTLCSLRAVLLGTSCVVSASIATSDWAAAEESATSSTITIEQASSMLLYSGDNDRFGVEVAPNYSEELGFSLKGAVGGYLTDAMALGLIVEYGENKREYLANAGLQFTDELSFVGTVGLLEENNEYVDSEGREKVQQMEYGASLKSAYAIGFLSGFELNGYLADTDADSDSVETGKLYGVQLLTDLDLTDTTHVKIGGGYEWLEWDETGDDDNRWTFSAEAVQQLGDVISMTGNAKLGASEFVYGGGVAFDLSNGGMNTNTLSVNASYIDGRNGIEDDQRIELSWTFGFGAGPSTSVAAADLTDKSDTIRAAADVALVSPSNNLLNDVIKRPSYLPERVLARAAASPEAAGCQVADIYPQDNQGLDNNYEPTIDMFEAYADGTSSPVPNGLANLDRVEVYVGAAQAVTYVKAQLSEFMLFSAQFPDGNVFATGDPVKIVIYWSDGSCVEDTRPAQSNG